MRRYIADVFPATDDEVLSSLHLIYGTLPVPDCAANDAGHSSEAAYFECHRFERLSFTEWARFITWRDYSLVL